jgi:hypothetical protein
VSEIDKGEGDPPRPHAHLDGAPPRRPLTPTPQSRPPHLYADGGGETDVVSQYTQWNLPALEFEGTWEALVYDDDGDAEEPAAAAAGGAGSSSSSSSSSSSTGGADGGKRARSSEGAGAAADPEGDAGGSLVGSRLKPALLQYAASALLFSDAGVDTSLISWNHVILLHGPPGTGKTSLCKALAHKLAIRLSDRYPSAQLIEINAHSLFSRWFSESGKLVHRLFAHIGELVADEDSLVFLLIDEVESLTAARKAAVSGRCVALSVSFVARGGGCAPYPIHTCVPPLPPFPLPPRSQRALRRRPRRERRAHGHRLVPDAEERPPADDVERVRGH